MARLIKIDKNGTKYYVDDVCPKCQGHGYIDYYAHVSAGVCFLCGGSGKYETHWKEMTPEYAQKLADRRLAKARKTAPERNAKYFKANGFSEDGETWVVMGDTYAIKDQLKAAGCKWNNILGWHFDHETEFNTVKVDKSDIMDEAADGTFFLMDSDYLIRFINELKAEHAPKTESEYVGNIGDKVEMALTFKADYSFDTQFGLAIIYKFADQDGNTITWKTSTAMSLKAGNVYTVKGTIKDHTEYKGDKQTVLTRCKVAAAQ